MKNLNLILLFSLFVTFKSFAVSTDLNCKRPEGLGGFVGGTHFYSTFLSVSSELSGAYTYLYQNVDDIVEKKLRSLCKKKVSRDSKLTSIKKSCFQACSSEVANFHNKVIKTKFFKKPKIRKQTKECKAVCDYSYRLQKKGYDDISTGAFGAVVRSLPAE